MRVLEKINKVFNIFTYFRKEEPNVLVTYGNEKYILDKDGFYDHKEPKLMTNEEIKMAELRIEQRDQLQNYALVDGKEMSLNDIQKLMPPVKDFPIPGQIIKDNSGKVKQVPMAPVNKAIDPNQLPQYQEPVTEHNIAQQLIESDKQFMPIQPTTPSVVKLSNQVEFDMFEVDDACYMFLMMAGIEKEKTSIKVKHNRLFVSSPRVNFTDVVTANEQEKKNLGKRNVKKAIVNTKSNKASELKCTFEFKNSIDEKNVKAKYENGVLELYLPYISVEDSENNIVIL